MRYFVLPYPLLIPSPSTYLIEMAMYIVHADGLLTHIICVTFTEIFYRVLYNYVDFFK